MSPYIRTVRTSSGATAVQIVHSSRRGSRDIEHIGSGHDEVQVELLRAAARQRIAAGQGELALCRASDSTGGHEGVGGRRGPDPTAGGGAAVPISGSRMGHLWDALEHAYIVLGFDAATEDDIVFRDLVLARIVEPTSKFDVPRVLEEVGVASVSYPTITRRLPGYAKPGFRQALSSACTTHAGLGAASLVLYDVSTLYFETDAGDGFREPGFSKERRLEPQITIGLLTDASGFPLAVNAFEGNKAETTTIVPALREFMAAHALPDVTIVADAGIVSAGNQKAVEDAGLSFILGARIPDVPYVVKAWRKNNPDTEIPDGHVFVQPWPAGATDGRRDQVIYYQYRADRARRTLRGIDEQIAKAEKAVAGTTPVKRNRFVQLSGGTRTVNRALEAKARDLAGLKGYVTNLAACPDGTPVTAEFVIDAYHRLFQIEKSFRMSKHDLQARPVYARKQDSIEAHLTVVFAALALSRWLEHVTGWSIKRFVKTARRYREVEIRVGAYTVTAEDPVPDDLREALERIYAQAGS